jgi:hypothetical protein
MVGSELRGNHGVPVASCIAKELFRDPIDPHMPRFDSRVCG